ncbi:MAG: DsbA family protein [Acidobacteriota bacterium]|nr:DsbA family protein [Acidobacteriota bacterium]
MKSFLIVYLLIFSLSVFAQKPEEVSATANGRTYTAPDLAPQVQQELAELPAVLKNARQSLLDQQIADTLLELEATAQKTTVEKLFESEVKNRVAVPTDKEIQAVYDANRATVGEQTLEQVKPQIVAFLQRDAGQKAYTALISNLKSKYKVTMGKDVNAANLSRLEDLATVGDRQISVENFEAKHRVALSDIEADVYDDVRGSLEQIVYSNLLVAEAKAQNLDTSDFIAREITNNVKDYSDAERIALEANLRERLFKKYHAQFKIKQIAPVVQTVATENQPSRGKTDAPVTVVMFSDFQCSACSAAHPILQSVLKTYADKIRFVVRDFPLTQIHENAYNAALAANAAHAQGRFFEYTEILYHNQNKLDEASLIEYASQIGLNVKQFTADLKSKKFAPEIEKDIADGNKLGISGTPTVYVNGVKVRQLTAEGFRRTIDRALKK